MKTQSLKRHLKAFTAFAQDRSGGAAIVMGVAIPVVLGGLAFGSEVAYWEFARRELQNQTDTAAFAAGTQVRSGKTADEATAAAKYVAVASRFRGDVGNITVEYPPASAPATAGGINPNGDDSYVYVTIDDSIPRRFTKFFSSSRDVSISAEAIARIESGRPACVLALHPSTAGAISTGGSTNVQLNGCDIAANSISSSAIEATGNGSNVEAECISAVGDVSVNSTYNLQCPEPISNGPLTADPYRRVPTPATTDCTSTHTLNQFPNQGSGSMRCYSGSSAGVTVSNNTTLASNTTYVFRNTGTSTLTWRINGNRTVSGTGVSLVFIGDWSVEANGNSTLNITAPITGPYKGLAIFGDRSSNVDIDVSGNNVGKIVGAIYSPNKNSHILYTGSSVTYSAGQCTQVIGGTVEFTGNSNFSTNCSLSGTTAIISGQSVKIVG